MGDLQKTLDSLQPYVIGIRYVDGTPVVDVVYKEGWTLPESNIVKKAKGNEEMNYYMLFSEKDGIGLDELLEYVDITIKVNVEKEKKHELLKVKVNELKELFKKTSLTKLQRLQFTYNDEDLTPSINELDIEEPIEEESILPEIPTIENTSIESIPEPMTDEDREILEEERRAENYKRFQENKKTSTQLEQIKNRVELPPKKISERLNDICECGPDEACNVCIDKKSL